VRNGVLGLVVLRSVELNNRVMSGRQPMVGRDHYSDARLVAAGWGPGAGVL